MQKQTKEEYCDKFNLIMRSLRNLASDLDNGIDWSTEDLEVLGQERIQDLQRQLAKLNCLVTTPFTAEEI